jgi:Fe2+ transport system protein FeoA
MATDVLAPTVMSLEQWPEGARVRVTAVGAEDSDGCRLRELGLFEGAEIVMVSQGDPVVVSVFGNRFAICRRCACHVEACLRD